MYPGPHQEQGWGWRHKTGLSPPVKYFTDRSKAVLLLWIFYVFVLSCVCYVLCASVYMCFVVTCWERADLLALVCGVFCEFVTFPLVSWVRCGTWLYRFLIFATLLTFILWILMYHLLVYVNTALLSKKAIIRNLYNQVPHLTSDTTWEIEKHKKTSHTREPRG